MRNAAKIYNDDFNFQSSTYPEKAKTMNAFNNDPKLRDAYVNRALTHEKADNYMQNRGYWKHGGGNPSGCLTQNNISAPQELERIGIPQALTYLSDQIFEHLSEGKYQTWTHRYITAIKSGANLEPVASYFIVWLLTEEIQKRFDTKKYAELFRACNHIAKLHWRTIGETGDMTPQQWEEAIKIASRITKTLSYAAAYADTHDTLAGAYASYVVNYSARIMVTPTSGSLIISSAVKSGTSPEKMSDILLRIIKGLDRDITRSNAPVREGMFMHNFLELLK